MSFLSDYIRGSATPVTQIMFLETTTFSPPSNMMGLVVLIGAGGSGGLSLSGDTGTNGQRRMLATGGNAGGCVMQMVRFQSAYNYTFTMSGGATAEVSGTNISTGTAYNGNDGSDTYLTSTAPGWTEIRAEGGEGGKAANADGTGTYNTAISFDRTNGGRNWGSGGDLIFPGGCGGEITFTNALAASRYCSFATGGGAVNLGGLPEGKLDGGSIDNKENTFNTQGVATGGGGVMGRGGDIVYNSGDGDRASGGGSATKNGGDIDTTSGTNTTSAGGGDMRWDNGTMFALRAKGGDGVISSVITQGEHGDEDSNTDFAGGGGGGGYIYTTSNTTDKWAARGGRFGGGGGMVGGYHVNKDNTSAGGGSGSYGGGGSGVVTFQELNNNYGYSGPGGRGVAFIFFMSDFGRVVI